MYKVQLTLTPEETQILNIKASQLGYSVTKLIKLMVGKEVLSLIEEYPFPTIQLSEKAIKKIEQAHQEHKAGKTIRLDNINDLDNL